MTVEVTAFSVQSDSSFQNTLLSASVDGDGSGTDDFGLDVWLFQDDAFKDWKKSVYWDSASTDIEERFAYVYSDYTLQMQCNLANISGSDTSVDKSGWGCCLRDESIYGGGYCMVVNSTQDGIDTYFVTDDEFRTVLADPYDLTTLTPLDEQYDGLTKFYHAN